jgi:protein O-GlcNAc transferase
MRNRLVTAFDEFHDVRRMSDKEAAKILYDRQVDIAVDLMGYTLDSRPGIFAHRAPPIQVSYPGFPATIGTQFLIRSSLPSSASSSIPKRSFICPIAFRSTIASVRSPSTHRRGRGWDCQRKAFVFSCFDAIWKITPAIFDIWMQLLHQVEGSVLWLIWDNESAQSA